MEYSNKLQVDGLKADMAWMISKRTGLIQLGFLLPLDVLYPESHGSGCIGGLRNKHHNSFAKFISNFNPSSDLKLVVILEFLI